MTESFRVIPINPEIARLALELDLPHGDPFDCVIAATAKTHASHCSPGIIQSPTRDR